MSMLEAPDRAPENKAFVLVTLAPPAAYRDIKDPGVRKFSTMAWEQHNKILTWACPELASRIKLSEREGLWTLLSDLRAGHIPESRIVGPQHASIRVPVGTAFIPVRDIQKVSFAQGLGIPLNVLVSDDYGQEKKDTKALSDLFNGQGAILRQWMYTLGAIDLTGTFPDLSLRAAYDEQANALGHAPPSSREFRYDL